jgi:hypothetical protein
MDKLHRLAICTLGIAFGALPIAWAQKITIIDAPGAGTAPGQGTDAVSISPSGRITGFFRDTNWVRHAFLRTSDGTFTIIDAPGAGTCSTPCGDTASGPGTRAYSINPAGTIIGFYNASANGTAHGYARTSNGTFIEIDAPDAGNGPSPQGTYPGSESGPYTINPAGAITGYYIDSLFREHGFVRTPDGTITEFDPPNSVFTFPYAINPAGAITGIYFDSTTVTYRGFLRAANGTITAFDDPNAGPDGSQGQGTFPGGITPSGILSGNYQDASNVFHGFVGALDSFATFDASGAGTGAFQGTIVNSSNYPGDVTGQYFDASFVSHGFVRDKQGKITSFDVLVTGGTVPEDINQSGAITGFFIDTSTVYHGFLRSK